MAVKPQPRRVIQQAHSLSEVLDQALDAADQPPQLFALRNGLMCIQAALDGSSSALATVHAAAAVGHRKV